MGHRTLINGTAYTVKSGTAKIEGTGYRLYGGRTMVGGTSHNIKLSSPVQVHVPTKRISLDGLALAEKKYGTQGTVNYEYLLMGNCNIVINRSSGSAYGSKADVTLKTL